MKIALLGAGLMGAMTKRLLHFDDPAMVYNPP
jgi:hypothetical protein